MAKQIHSSLRDPRLSVNGHVSHWLRCEKALLGGPSSGAKTHTLRPGLDIANGLENLGCLSLAKGPDVMGRTRHLR